MQGSDTMEVYIIKKNNVFIPAYESDKEVANKINDGAILHCKIYKGHSVQQHKAVFALARTVLMNMPEHSKWGQAYKNSREKATYNFVKAMELELGFFEVMMKFDGTAYVVPSSLKYDMMDRETFNLLFQAYLDKCAELLGCDAEQLLLQSKENL